VAVIVLDVVLAYAQELQAERATHARRELLPVRARVRRDGAGFHLPTANLVPGAVVPLAEGARLPTDAGPLEVKPAPLTGESQPVVRSASAVQRAPSGARG
jgi:magnesium-transporting ATPase (P-type)